MEHDREHEEAVRDAVSSIDELTAELFVQLDELRATLRDTSARDLAQALDDLRRRVDDLLAAGPGTLGSVVVASLESIAAAMRRIERARRRLLDELAPPAGAEAALRSWTRSAPGDGRVRPDVDA